MSKKQVSKRSREQGRNLRSIREFNHSLPESVTIAQNTPRTDIGEQYRKYGGIAPPPHELISFRDQLREVRKPRQGVLLADVCIDLAATQPQKAKEHLTMANDALQLTLRAAGVLLQNNGVSASRVEPVAILAKLRRAELGKWQAVAEDSSLPDEYDNLLLAAKEASDLSSKSPGCQGIIAESIPVLLGERADKHGLDIAWGGRLALTREDKGFDNAAGNANWDCGIIFSESARDLLNPAVRVQVKRGKIDQATNYTLRGVLPLSASQHGFANTTAVIESCLVETGYLGMSNISGKFMSSDQLDDITGSIHACLVRAI